MKFKKSFRSLEKEGLEIQMPVRIAGLIRRRAAAQRRSMSEVCTELLARAMEIDPAQYGIRPGAEVASEA